MVHINTLEKFSAAGCQYLTQVEGKKQSNNENENFFF